MGPGDGGTVEFFVDLTALADLRSRLLSIQESLSTLGASSTHTDAQELGGAEVAQAVNNFLGRWRDGRKQIEENLTVSVKLLDKAIEGYEKADAALANAAAGNGEAAQ